MEGMESDMKKVTAEYVRQNFPSCVAFADECRAAFGDGVKMIWAIENGKTIGKRPVDGVVVRLSDIDLTPIMTPEELRRSGREKK